MINVFLSPVLQGLKMKSPDILSTAVALESKTNVLFCVCVIKEHCTKFTLVFSLLCFITEGPAPVKVGGSRLEDALNATGPLCLIK